MRKKMTNLERAKQFMPFNSLRGYYDLIGAKNITKEDKKTLDEEEIEKINNKLKNIKKRDIIRIVYYKDYGYTSIFGMVSMIDFVYKKIRIIDEEINFDDIFDILPN